MSSAKRVNATTAVTTSKANDPRYMWMERQLKSHFRNIDFRSTSFSQVDEVYI